MHFVDTNVIVYGFDEGNPAKRERSGAIMRKLWETRGGRLSQQVLQEFYVTVTRKLNPALPRARKSGICSHGIRCVPAGICWNMPGGSGTASVLSR